MFQFRKKKYVVLYKVLISLVDLNDHASVLQHPVGGKTELAKIYMNIPNNTGLIRVLNQHQIAKYLPRSLPH